MEEEKSIRAEGIVTRKEVEKISSRVRQKCATIDDWEIPVFLRFLIPWISLFTQASNGTKEDLRNTRIEFNFFQICNEKLGIILCKIMLNFSSIDVKIIYYTEKRRILIFKEETMEILWLF